MFASQRIVPVLIVTPLPKETDQLLRIYTSDKVLTNASSKLNASSPQHHQQQQAPTKKTKKSSQQQSSSPRNLSPLSRSSSGHLTGKRAVSPSSPRSPEPTSPSLRNTASPATPPSPNNNEKLYYWKKKNSRVSEWFIEDRCLGGQQRVLFRITHTGARHAPSLRQALYKQAIENDSVIVFLFSYTKQINLESSKEEKPTTGKTTEMPDKLGFSSELTNNTTLYRTVETYMREFAELYTQLRGPSFLEAMESMMMPAASSLGNPTASPPQSSYPKQSSWIAANQPFFTSGCYMMSVHVELHQMTKTILSDYRKQIFNNKRYASVFDDKCCIEFDLNLGTNVSEMFQRIFKTHIDLTSIKLMLQHQLLLEKNQSKFVKQIDAPITKKEQKRLQSIADQQGHDHEHSGEMPEDSKQQRIIEKSPDLLKKHESLPTSLNNRGPFTVVDDSFKLNDSMIYGRIEKKIMDDLDHHREQHHHHQNKTLLQFNKLFATKIFGKKKSKDKDSKKLDRDRSSSMSSPNLTGTINLQMNLIAIPDKFVMNDWKHSTSKVNQQKDEESISGSDHRNTMSDTFFHDRMHFPLPFPYHHQQKPAKPEPPPKNDLHTIHYGMQKTRQKQPIIIVPHNRHRAKDNEERNKDPAKVEEAKNMESELLENEQFWADDPTENDLYGETTATSCLTDGDISDDEGTSDSTKVITKDEPVTAEPQERQPVSQIKRAPTFAHGPIPSQSDFSMIENACSSDLFDPDSLIEGDEFTFKSEADYNTQTDVTFTEQQWRNKYSLKREVHNNLNSCGSDQIRSTDISSMHDNVSLDSLSHVSS